MAFMRAVIVSASPEHFKRQKLSINVAILIIFFLLIVCYLPSNLIVFTQMNDKSVNIYVLYFRNVSLLLVIIFRFSSFIYLFFFFKTKKEE
jgi:hypothetical protein